MSHRSEIEVVRTPRSTGSAGFRGVPIVVPTAHARMAGAQKYRGDWMGGIPNTSSGLKV